MSSELSGKVAIVTGGASGIGRATVLALAGAGAAVAVLDRDEAGTTKVASEVGGAALPLSRSTSRRPNFSPAWSRT